MKVCLRHLWKARKAKEREIILSPESNKESECVFCQEEVRNGKILRRKVIAQESNNAIFTYI